MALEQRNRTPDEGLRSSTLRWLELATVVYAWTDRREANEDRVWWKTAGARLYLPFAKPPQPPAAPAAIEPAVERFDKEPALH